MPQLNPNSDLMRKTFVITKEDEKLIKRIGKKNFSLGIRIIAQQLRKKERKIGRKPKNKAQDII